MDSGGAEYMLFNILNCNSDIRKHSKVYFFKNPGDIYNKLININVSVEHIPLGSFKEIFFTLVYLIKTLSINRNSILHLWMYHPAVIIGLLAKLLLNRSIIWSLHHSNFDPNYNKTCTLLLIKLSSYLSYFVPNIIHTCSKFALKEHIRIGYNNNFIYIPNGVDTEKFTPNIYKPKVNYFPNIIKPYIIGFFARWDPLKNHKGLLEQFSFSLKKNTSLCLLLCGKDIDFNNYELISLIRSFDIPLDNIRLLGNQKNINNIYHNLDLFCLPSHGEAFPVVICESLSSSVPCISTNVGDCSQILADICSVVDITKFNREILYYSSLSKNEIKHLKKRCRDHILVNYQLSNVAENYLKLYRQLY